jgi:L-threonylcarbamoyladenylate synthase
MPDARDAAGAAAELAAGRVLAFPTETVYGLGGDALNAGAVNRIFALKGRPADHPLIVHFADPAAIDQWAENVPDAARTLARRFWPGPLTMILRKSRRLPAVVTGGQDSVGLRCPSHPLAQELLREFARIGSGAVAAPSANKFGHVSPTSAQHVRDEFGPDLFILDGGACEVGLESTIVDLSRGVPVLLRPGGIARSQLEAALGTAVGDRDDAAPRASGTLAAHYAPRTALALIRFEELASELAAPAKVAVLALSEPPPAARPTAWITAPATPAAYGHDLYANLRKLDASGAKRILVVAPPANPEWEAVNDRLTRAAAGALSLDDEP